MEFTAAILPASLVFIILSLDLIYWEAVAGADICVCRRSMPDLGQPGMLAAINPGERLPESHVTTQPAGSDRSGSRNIDPASSWRPAGLLAW